MGRAGGDAISEADGSQLSVIVTSTEEACSHAAARVERRRFGEPELRHIQGRLLWMDSDYPDEVIEHLRHPMAVSFGRSVPSRSCPTSAAAGSSFMKASTA